MSHTPGPWLITGDSGMVYALDVLPETYRGMPVYSNRFDAQLHVDPRLGSHEERAANARLIAAAPDLLSALKALLNATMFKDHPAESQLAIDAISKAEGGA